MRKRKIDKVLLILPPINYINLMDEYNSPPLGLGYLASVLRKNGFQVKIIDGHVEKLKIKEIVQKAKAFQPDFIGFSIVTEARHTAAKSIKFIRETFPESIIAAGGPHPTLALQDTLEKMPELDLIIRKEGEETILDVVSSINHGKGFHDVLGISYRDNNKIIHSPSRPPIEQLDRIPFPAIDLFPLDKYSSTLKVPGKGDLRFASIITSRGCPMNCTFCATSLFWGKRVRCRSIDNIIKEIRYLIDNYGFECISIEDDTFFISSARVTEFCNSLIENKINISWSCYVRVDTLNKEILRLMRESGCYHIIFGAESGNNYILNSRLNKFITKEQIENVSIWCDELNIKADRFFMIGNPGETYELAMQTIEFMEKLDKFYGKNFLSVLRIYPGTEIEHLAKENGIIPNDFSWMDSTETRTITLPSTFGDAPIFLDKMTWSEITDILFRWARQSNYPVYKKAWRAIKDVRTIRDIINLIIAGLIFVKYMASSIFSRRL